MEERQPAAPTREHLQLIYGELKDQLALQLAELDALDRKATVLLAPVGVLIGFALNNAAQLTLTQLSGAAFHVGLAILVLALLSGIAVLWPREISVAPKASLPEVRLSAHGGDARRRIFDRRPRVRDKQSGLGRQGAFSPL